MANVKAAIPKGTRDFGPQVMIKRNYIFDTIKKVFKKYGYQEIQTPTMENLDTLTGKYGDEGDQLIFKILESGEYTDPLHKDLIQKYIQNQEKEVISVFLKTIVETLANNLDNVYEWVLNDKFLALKKINEILPPSVAFQDDNLKIEVIKRLIEYLFNDGSDTIFDGKTRIKYYLDIQDKNVRSEKILKGLRYKSGKSEIVGLLEIELYLRKILSPLNTTKLISKKALRYDLTVPFARYVVMHQNEITSPFKRFQVQPVWRADRPQRGRYREFYQCDADVVGSDSLLNEAEFVCIYDEALSNLGLNDFSVKINNRKILSGIAELIGRPDQIVDLTVAIDKLDKIGLDGVEKELLEKSFTAEDIAVLKPVILLSGSNEEKLESLAVILSTSKVGQNGIEEIYKVLNYLKSFSLNKAKVELDLTLARGLNYYTGCIFEVKTNEATMGSIGGGGRYDDLTGMFGKEGLTGVGISFGADRIYDVLEELNLFPSTANESTKVLICVFGEAEETYSLAILNKLRQADINAELFPFGAKMKKQMQYANDKSIPYVLVIGGDEMQSGQLSLKNMATGEQVKIGVEELVEQLG